MGDVTSAKQKNGRLTIGFLTSEIERDWAMLPWLGMVDAAREGNINLFTFPGYTLQTGDFEAQRNVLYDLVDAEQLDGLIIWPPPMGGYIAEAEWGPFLRHYSPFMPVVLLEAGVGEVLPVIPYDNYHGMRAAITHLIEAHGRRHIAFAGMFEHHFGFQERYRAYADTLAEYGLPFQAELARPWFPDNTVVAGLINEEVLTDWLERVMAAGADAVVAITDGIAFQVIGFLQSRGIRVPEDIAVIGFDNIARGELALPALTTVRPDWHAMGRQAVDALISLIEGKEPYIAEIPSDLIVRESCGCLLSAVVEAATAPAAGVHEEQPLALVVDEQRASILAEMKQAAGETKLPEGWADRHLDQFVADLTDESQEHFLPGLIELLTQLMATGADVAHWQGVVSALRRRVLRYLDRNSLWRAESVCQQARVMIGELARRAQAKQALQVEQQAQILREIGQELITTFNIDALMTVLVKGLPRIGVLSAYLALYKDPQQPTEESYLVLAYCDGRRIKVEESEARFPSRQLVPATLLPPDRPFSFVVEPLFFRESQLGFILLEVGPRQGRLYEILRGEISSALQGARLLEQTQSALHETQGLLQAAQAILGATEFDDICRNLIRHYSALMGTNRMALFLVDHDRRQVVLSVVQGFFGGELDLTYTDLQSGISGQVFKSKQPILSLTPDDGIEPEATRERRRQICPGPLIVVPLINKGRVIGTITAINEPNQPAFTSHHVELLMALATQAAAAIENVRLFEETQKARNELEQRIVERTAELAQANVVLKEQIAVRLKAEAEREVLIAELEAKNAELERFTYTVSHDLKSPLITIQGFLGYVEQAALSGDVNRVKADIARITNAASKMKQLLDELLELSRVGRLASPPQEISLDELAHEAMDMVQGRLVEHDVEMLIAPNLPVVYGDLSRLRELLENLLDNAAKYMGDQLHPCIEIGVRRDRPEPVFFVRDNGVGIDPRYHQKIFGLFEKLDHGSEGSGMGLAIIKRIIEVHGGRIWVESEGVGQGSTFCFTLPLPASRE